MSRKEPIDEAKLIAQAKSERMLSNACLTTGLSRKELEARVPFDPLPLLDEEINIGDKFICSALGLIHTVLLMDSSTILTEWDGYGVDRDNYCTPVKNKNLWSIDLFKTQFRKVNK